MLKIIVHDLKAGDRLGVFSYGSGSCAEFYSFLYTDKSKTIAAEAGLKNLLKNRYKINVAQYEAIETLRERRIKEGDFVPNFDMIEGMYNAAYKEKDLLVYTGSKGFYRSYKFS